LDFRTKDLSKMKGKSFKIIILMYQNLIQYGFREKRILEIVVVNGKGLSWNN